MFTCEAMIIGKKKHVIIDASIDTGFDGGLILDRSHAKALGATLVAGKQPRDLIGYEIPGQSTVLKVTLVDCGIKEFETPVFCPDDEIGEPLIGAFWLSKANACVEIGALSVFAFTERAKQNPSNTSAKNFDWSKVVVRWR